MSIRRHVALSSALTTALALGIGTPAAADEIVNGGFDGDTTTGWNVYGGSVTFDAGAACLTVPTGTGPYGAAFQQRVALDPDTDYTLSLEGRITAGTPSALTVVVQLPRDPWTGYLPPQAIAGQLSGTATTLTYDFHTPTDLPPADEGGPADGPNASVEIQHTGTNSEPYTLCIDNVSLAPPGSEQVVNGGFDDGTAGWTSMYPNPFVQDGWGCVPVPAGTGAYGAGIGQLVTLEPDTDYALTFSARLLEGSGAPGPIRAVVQLPRDPFTQYLPEKAIAAQLSTTPTDFEFTFTTPSDLPPAADGGDPAGPHAELTIQQNGPTVDAYTLCVDDVSLIGGAAPEPYEPDTGPAVRVNHVGYFAEGPKHATLVSTSAVGVEWQLVDGGGDVVSSGVSTPAGFDESAGLDVHVIDFSAYSGTGDGFTIAAGGEVSFAFAIGVDDVYDQLRYDALKYYYPARSGVAIDGGIAGAAYARPAGHVSSPADGAVNTGDVDVPCQSTANQTDDGGTFYYGSEWACPAGYTLDVVGGWYDAGDHGKYVVNGGISVAQLMGTYERAKNAPTADTADFADGTLAVPESSNGVPDVLDEARWELEWMMSMQVPAGAGEQLIDGTWRDVVGMVHHKIHDEGWTGLPLLPHTDPQVRSLHRPSTAATLNFAAVAAQGARLWAPYDEEFARRLLAAGKRAWKAARANPAIYAPAADGNEGGGPYNDANVTDEFYWAAAELYITTGSRPYRDYVLTSVEHTADAFPDSGFSWDSMAALARLDLATVPNKLPGRATVQQSVLDAADDLLAVQAGEPFGHPYAGDATGNYVWGSNSQVLNNMVVLGSAYDLSGVDAYRAAVMEGMDYLLGRNSLGWSYVTGYGEPTHNSDDQHSRWYSAQLDPSLPHPPTGSISGGPNSNSAQWDPTAAALFAGDGCAPQRCYIDDIQSWSTNEITVNWNAPLAWVASFLADQDDGTADPTPECTVDYRWRRLAHGLQYVTVVIRNDTPNPWRGWSLTWSFAGSESIRIGLGAWIESSGADVMATSWTRGVVRPGRSAEFHVLVAGGPLPGAPPERFRVGDHVCAAGRVGGSH